MKALSTLKQNMLPNERIERCSSLVWANFGYDYAITENIPHFDTEGTLNLDNSPGILTS